MTDGQAALKAHAIDAVKASPVAGYLAWIFSGHTISYIGALAGTLYGCLVLYQKLGEVGFYRWLRRTFRKPPSLPVRQPQDE